MRGVRGRGITYRVAMRDRRGGRLWWLAKVGRDYKQKMKGDQPHNDGNRMNKKTEKFCHTYHPCWHHLLRLECSAGCQ